MPMWSSFLVDAKAKWKPSAMSWPCLNVFLCWFWKVFLSWLSHDTLAQTFKRHFYDRITSRFYFSFLSTISGTLRLQISGKVAGKVPGSGSTISSWFESGTLLATEVLEFVWARWPINKSSPNLFRSLSGLSPFVGADDFETMTNVSLAKFSFDYAPFEEISSLAKDFVENLLMKEPSKRLTAKNALNHEWLHCTKGNSEREITLSLTKTKLKRYVILRRFVLSHQTLMNRISEQFFVFLVGVKQH